MALCDSNFQNKNPYITRVTEIQVAENGVLLSNLGCKRIVKLLKERWEEFVRQLKEWEERLKEKGNLEEVKTQ